MRALRTCSLLIPLALVLSALGAQAQQVYRIVGPDGKVTFSDRPPSAEAAATSVGGAARPTTGAAPLPVALQGPAAKYPVTLYTASDCAPCDMGRNLLKQRGIPFTEKTVNTSEDAQAFQKLSTAGRLPLLMLGAQAVGGFAAGEWNGYLDAAGYPKTSALPPGYRPAPAEPLAPPRTADAQATPTAGTAGTPATPVTEAGEPPARKPRPVPPRKVDDNNPAGIKF